MKHDKLGQSSKYSFWKLSYQESLNSPSENATKEKHSPDGLQKNRQEMDPETNK